MEGVPLHEYIYNNEIVATLIYTNGSWIDVTDRVEVIEKPYVSVTNSLLHLMTNFVETSGSNYTMFGRSSIYSGTDGFNKTWAPHQSRLILFTGTRDVGAFWE